MKKVVNKIIGNMISHYDRTELPLSSLRNLGTKRARREGSCGRGKERGREQRESKIWRDGREFRVK